MRTILGRAVMALACMSIAAPNFAWAASVKVPEGTEFPMRLEDGLSSKTTQEGDRFTITLTDDVKLPDGTLLKAGYRGSGEVIHAEKSGMLGKTGKLSIRVDYMRVGEQRIRLRGSKAAQGAHNTGAQIVTVVFFGVFAGLIKGHNTEIPKGTRFNTFSDSDVDLETPVEAPPPVA